ncbi:MAG TPA: acetoacetate decarboxylase family protein [Jatrophihabitantaceae bacterium]|nr:acetoacetate decarboxylase family protein [Jatrophihabitantaceae bacterium]
MSAYPPEPWDLRGQLHASVFLVPLRTVPLGEVPPGWRPVRLGPFAVVGTAWVSYEPGGVLSYRELMVTVLVRRGLRLAPSIARIWVDSEASRDGGRALWGIPKELADFEFHGADFSATASGHSIATGTVRPFARLPGRWPVRFTVAQTLDGRARVTPVRSRARLGLSRATFAADPSGPLAFLAGRRPLLTLTIGEFRMQFGTRRGARGGDRSNTGVQ